MSQYIKKFSKYLAQSERSPATIKNYVMDLNIFSKWFVSTNGDELTPIKITATDLREYKQFLIHQESLKPSTVNRKLATIKSFLDWAEQVGYISNRFSMPKLLKETKCGPKWLNRREQNQLLRIVERSGNIRDIVIVKLLLNTGLRVQEVCNLKWHDVVISDRKGKLIVNQGKGNKRREIPLNKDARDALLEFGYAKLAGQENFIFNGQRGSLTPRGIQFMLKKYTAIANMDTISPHNLRHSFCKNLINAGIGIETVAVMAGHDSLETTRRYCEPSMLDLQKAVELIGELE